MSLLSKTMQDEAATLESILAPLLTGKEKEQTKKALTEKDLDRETAREQDWKAMQDGMATANTTIIAALSQVIHEEHRIRRDIKIGRATHKQLILSALSVAYNRLQDLNTRSKVLESGSNNA